MQRSFISWWNWLSFIVQFIDTFISNWFQILYDWHMKIYPCIYTWCLFYINKMTVVFFHVICSSSVFHCFWWFLCKEGTPFGMSFYVGSPFKFFNYIFRSMLNLYEHNQDHGSKFYKNIQSHVLEPLFLKHCLCLYCFVLI